MIVKMKKVQAVVSKSDRERLLEALQGLGVLHIEPIKPPQAVPEAEVAAALDKVRRAVQVLSRVEPTGEKPDISAREAAQEVFNIERAQAEYESQLSSLHRQMEQQAIWGEVTLDDFQVLKSAGILPTFYVCPKEKAGEFRGEFVHVVGNTRDGKVIVALVSRPTGEAFVPEDAEPLPTLTTDNPTLRAQAAEIDSKRKRAAERLEELAHLLPEIELFQAELEDAARFSMALNSGLEEDELFAIQGWVPVDRSQTLPADLESKGISAAIQVLDPGENEMPPTLIKYPRWARPIKGLFDMLNTFPGYWEIDLSPFFMIAMPIFAAMLAGDAGYGVLFLLPVIFMRRRTEKLLGKEGTQLLLIFGVATLIWGLLSANFFGVKPDAVADIMPLERGSDDATQRLLIQISFVIGSLHLVLAHVRKSLAVLPDTRGIADIGWAITLLGMLGLVWMMIFDYAPVPTVVIIAGLAVGLVLAAAFGAPNRNPLKRVGVGLASSLLPMIGTFSDTMSYIRLMAVGMASYYIAYAFNDLGSTIADSATWAAAAPILVFGHGLNIVLIVIAIFAHGVRLNMLEFSSNAGVEWAGYPYAPFTKIRN